MKKVAIVFHRIDFDGLFSYAIARAAAESSNSETVEVTPVPFNYNDPIDDLPDWSVFDCIIIADIMLPVDIMKTLHNEFFDKVIWIDHHITAINLSKEHGYDDFNGIRDTAHAACVLSYMYFHPSVPYDKIPQAIRLAGAHDIWDKETYDWINIVQPMQYGLNLYTKTDYNVFWDLYDDILENYSSCVDDGKNLKDYMDGLKKTWCDRFSFDVEVDGHLKGIAMLCPMFSSEVFDSVSGSYDVCVVVEKNRKNEGFYNVSMYSGGRGLGDFSCGEYMKCHYNGGGHKGAAGGILDIDQFIRLVRDHKI